jgi:rRNA maturation RNase YbeY
LNINRKFLDHDFYTDIITFDLSEGKEINAEIYISIDRVRENARNLKVPLKQELQRVMFHGVLHLCGYKDKAPKDTNLIRQKEDYYLGKFNNSHINQ